MSDVPGLTARLEAFVHESAAADPFTRAVHKAAFKTKILASLIVLLAAPLYVGYRGAVDSWVLGFFGFLLAQLSALVLLSRTGRLLTSQAMAAAALIGLGLAWGFGARDASGAAFAWLAAAPLEAAFSLNRALVKAVAAAALLAAASAILWGASGQGGGAPALVALTALPALAYGSYLTYLGVVLMRGRDRAERMKSARLDSLSDALGDLVMHMDRSGAVLTANAEAERLFRIAPRDLTGRGFFERVHVGDRPSFLTAVLDAADGARPTTATFRLRLGAAAVDGGRSEKPSFAWVEMRARRLQGGREGAAADVVAVVRDVSALKRHEAEIEEARAQAERTAAWKDRFLANVSHELRTPLNGIIGFSEMLCTKELVPADPAKQREYAEIILSSGQHLLSVVNSILDMSKIEAGRFDIQTEPFEVAPLIESCCDMIRLKAQERCVEIKRSCSPDLPELVADKRACKQILINLLSNAIKFTQAGGQVTVNARIEGNSLLLSVADTGIGISAADLPEIGSAFFQARAAYDRPYEGTGLGLSVVRGLVGLHGGSIYLDTAPGEGTCVTIRLPRDGRGRFDAPAPPAPIQIVSKSALNPSTSLTGRMKKIA